MPAQRFQVMLGTRSRDSHTVGKHSTNQTTFTVGGHTGQAAPTARAPQLSHTLYPGLSHFGLLPKGSRHMSTGSFLTGQLILSRTTPQGDDKPPLAKAVDKKPGHTQILVTRAQRHSVNSSEVGTRGWRFSPLIRGHSMSTK